MLDVLLIVLLVAGLVPLARRKLERDAIQTITFTFTAVTGPFLDGLNKAQEAARTAGDAFYGLAQRMAVYAESADGTRLAYIPNARVEVHHG